MTIPHDKASQDKRPTITLPSHTALIDYLGKKFEVDYVISPDHNGDDQYTVESIKHDGEEWSDFLECMKVEYKYEFNHIPRHDPVIDVITRMIEAQHKEPEPEYDSMTVEDE